jgi:SNF2 family DNA or RNA helicase
MRRVYGKVWLKDGLWNIQGEPHLLLRLKRIFARIWAGQYGVVTLKDTDEIRREIVWLLERYSMTVSRKDRKALDDGARRHVEKLVRLDRLIDRNYVGREYEMAIPAREYQKQAAEMVLENGYLLLADDLGTGKTVGALAVLTQKATLPAVVVTLSGTMPRQWKDMAAAFLPKLLVHVVKKGTPYELPKADGRGPDLVVLNYHKLSGWAETLAAYAKTVVFDECQELRRRQSQKYQAAEYLARRARWTMGLSATPIFNLGGEIWSVVNVLREDALGTYEEFLREWCYGERDHRKAPAVKDPKALGSHLRAEHIMLRRTRKDLGRELPPLTKIPQYVESDEAAIDGIKDSAAELARIILSNEKIEGFERLRASEQFDQILRQATGVAKAPYVADFIRLLVEADDEPVIVFAWHRAVYDILLSKLSNLGPVMFTGSETPAQKHDSLERFTKRESRVMLMSLRAGQGMDGLQKVCRTVVFAELDWSPAVHDQCTGRVFRDGQEDPVTAIFCVAERGSDPSIAETLGVKTAQIEGIRDPEGALLEELQTDPGRIRALAQRYMEKIGRKAPTREVQKT